MRTPVFEAEVRTWEQAIAICHKQHAAAESSEERWRIGVVITELEMNLDGAQVRLQVERALLAELAKVAPAPRYRVVSVQEYVALVLTGAAVHQWNVLPGETLASSLAKWSRSASDGRGEWLVVGPSSKQRGLLDVIGEDGGEPEDQLLVRDWKWVAPAMCAAFDEGFAEARAAAGGAS